MNYNHGGVGNDNCHGRRSDSKTYPNDDEFAGDYADLPDEWLSYLCGLGKNTGRNSGDVIFFDSANLHIPCIAIDAHRYDSLERAIHGREVAASIDANLNVFDDRAGTVFVEMTIDVSDRSQASDVKAVDACDASGFAASNSLHDCKVIQERLILNARQYLSFFEALAKCSMIAFVSIQSQKSPTSQNVVVIQLPKSDKIEYALQLIRQGISKH